MHACIKMTFTLPSLDDYAGLLDCSIDCVPFRRARPPIDEAVVAKLQARFKAQCFNVTPAAFLSRFDSDRGGSLGVVSL